MPFAHHLLRKICGQQNGKNADCSDSEIKYQDRVRRENHASRRANLNAAASKAYPCMCAHQRQNAGKNP